MGVGGEKSRVGELYSPSYVPLCTQVWIPGDRDPSQPAMTEALLSTSILGCWRQILHSGCSLGGPRTENKASHCHTVCLVQEWKSYQVWCCSKEGSAHSLWEGKVGGGVAPGRKGITGAKDRSQCLRWSNKTYVQFRASKVFSSQESRSENQDHGTRASLAGPMQVK